MQNHNNNQQQTEIRDEQLLAGISKDLQTMPSLYLGGTALAGKVKQSVARGPGLRGEVAGDAT